MFYCNINQLITKLIIVKNTTEAAWKTSEEKTEKRKRYTKPSWL